MALLSLADVKTVLDSIAQQAVVIKTLGFDAAATGYTNNRATILAATTSSDFAAIAALASSFKDDIPATMASLFESRRVALETHLGGIGVFLLANDSRCSYQLRDLLRWTLVPAVVFPPVHSGDTKLGLFTMSGAAAGTFVNGAAINTTLYGKAWLRVKVITQTVVTETVLTIIGTKFDGTAQSKTATITAGATIGTYFNVGTLGTSGDNFADVTNVTATGGEAANAFEIESRLERIIAL